HAGLLLGADQLDHIRIGGERTERAGAVGFASSGITGLFLAKPSDFTAQPQHFFFLFGLGSGGGLGGRRAGDEIGKALILSRKQIDLSNSMPKIVVLLAQSALSVALDDEGNRNGDNSSGGDQSYFQFSKGHKFESS